MQRVPQRFVASTGIENVPFTSLSSPVTQVARTLQSVTPVETCYVYYFCQKMLDKLQEKMSSETACMGHDIVEVQNT